MIRRLLKVQKTLKCEKIWNEKINFNKNLLYLAIFFDLQFLMKSTTGGIKKYICVKSF